MAVPCPHCRTPLNAEDLHRDAKNRLFCPHCRNSLELSSKTLSSRPAAGGGTTQQIGVSPEKELSGDSRYSLEVLDGNDPGKIFSIDKNSVTIGRRDCDIVLDDPEISRKHAIFTVHDDYAILKDLASTNGTYVEGLRIDQIKMENHSTFRLGTHQLEFLITDPPGQDS